jgi:hypothetical protein
VQRILTSDTVPDGRSSAKVQTLSIARELAAFLRGAERS